VHVCTYVGVGGWGDGGVHMHECAYSDNDHTLQSHTLHTFHYVRQHLLLFYKENIRYRNVLTFQVKSRQFI